MLSFSSLFSQGDAFLMALLDVPLLTERLHTLLVMGTFEEETAELEPQLRDLLHASKTARHNNSFHKLLEVVLLVGNYMNASNNQKGAFGFKLTVLDKLKNTKTVDNKGNLLHFIATLVEDNKVGGPCRKAVQNRQKTVSHAGSFMCFLCLALTLALCRCTGARTGQFIRAAETGG